MMNILNGGAHADNPIDVQEFMIAPVGAPDGTAERPKAPVSNTTSTSTVGLPRLSRISRPTTVAIAVMIPIPDCQESVGETRAVLAQQL